MSIAAAPDLSVTTKSTVGKRIAANTGMMLGAKAMAATLGFLTLVVANHALGNQVDFGIVLFVHAYMLFFLEVATFQSWQSLIRFGTDDVKNNDVPAFARLVKFGVLIDWISALVAFIAALGLFQVAAWMIAKFPGIGPDPETLSIGKLQLYTSVYCVIVLFGQLGTSIGVFRLFDKFRVLAVKALVMPICRLIGAVTAMFLGWGLEGFLLVWFIASLAGYLFLPIAAIIELKKRNLIGPIVKAKLNFVRPREGLWPFVWKSNIDSTLAASFMHLPVLLVMVVFGPAFVAVFKVADEIAKLLSEGVKLLDQVIYPELARLVSSGASARILKLVTRAGAMTLGLGLAMSAFVAVVGPHFLNATMGDGYSEAVILSILLVLGAAVLGAAAPLYPVFYAADKPERAIYARGIGLVVYILSFFVLSHTIGRTAPGWASIAGNFVAVTLVVFMVKRTLSSAVEKDRIAQNLSETIQSTEIIADKAANVLSATLIGESTAKLWGLPIRKWQGRALKKAGVGLSDNEASVHLGVNWVLSSALAKAFTERSNIALVSDGVIVGVNGTSATVAQDIIGQPPDDVDLGKLQAVEPTDIAGSYNKALRKTDPPYALNIEMTPIIDIERRQYGSSYKGITDFVTKWFWPVPAFYFTRWCAALRLTPNMVTTLSLIMMFAALYYFWQGQWALGFVTGWFMTFLDTVDGKLARTTMTYSAWGNIYDHGIDLIHPPFWYIAWFVGLGGSFARIDLMFWALVAIFVGYILDRLIEGLFILQHGFHIHVWRPINSGLRFITARRNPNMFIFMIGIMAMAFIPQAGIWGFYAVAIWTWACIVFNIGVVIAGTLTRKPVKSWMNA